LTEELAAFEETILVQAPPGAVVVGASISPDGKYGAALTLLPSASDYPMDDLFERVGDRWMDAGGGSGTGISWSSMSEDGSNGVIRYGDEAPPGFRQGVGRVRRARGRGSCAPRPLLFVAWDTDYHDDPRVVRFE
jgi:hypothetical protein